MRFKQVSEVGTFPKLSSLSLSTQKVVTFPLLKKKKKKKERKKEKKRKPNIFKTVSPEAKTWTPYYLILEFSIHP